MADIQFYHMAPSRSSIVHWMLGELGEPFEVKLLNYTEGENRQEEYLKVNPMGKVPAISYKGQIITEAAAICLFLADEFPDKNLTIPLGDKHRGEFLKWMFFGPSCIEPALISRSAGGEELPVGSVGWGSYDLVLDVLDNELQNKKYIVGDRFTAADVIVGSQIQWGLMFDSFEESESLKEYAGHLSDRPAYQRAQQNDMEWAPQSNP